MKAIAPALDPAVETNAQAVLQDAMQLLERVEQVAVRNDAQAEIAAALAKAAREERKAIEADRDQFTKPLRKVASLITARYKPAIDAYDSAITKLTQAVSGYRQQVAQAQAAAIREAAAAADATALAMAVQLPSAPKGVVESMRWAWSVEDIAKVPREYFVLDEARLDRELREHRGDLAVPGIRVEQRITTCLK